MTCIICGENKGVDPSFCDKHSAEYKANVMAGPGDADGIMKWAADSTRKTLKDELNSKFNGLQKWLYDNHVTDDQLNKTVVTDEEIAMMYESEKEK